LLTDVYNASFQFYLTYTWGLDVNSGIEDMPSNCNGMPDETVQLKIHQLFS